MHACIHTYIHTYIHTQVMLQSYDDACECPDSYTNMEVGVSRTNNNANFEDKLWKLSRTSYDQNTVDLMQDDHFTRPGTYYVTVRIDVHEHIYLYVYLHTCICTHL
jgi:hypothetical protein